MRFLPPEQLLSGVPQLRAERGVVHVWPLMLSGPESARAEFERVLSEEELAKARRFYHEANRVGYAFCHGVLRLLLGAYLGASATSLEFTQGEFGKPALAGAHAGAVSFNLSHSHGRGLIAIAEGREIGVDLEQENLRTDVLALSGYFFGPESQAIHDAAPDGHVEAFFRYWAAKEAVIKGHGAGLSLGLNRFHVLFEADLARAAVESLDTSRLAADWFVRRVACESGWHAAVAARGFDWDVRVMDGQCA
jgi:4'-phosphopantetheinyl transferase